ncbi:PSP1-domain-containing protein, partial [Acaromyces ingoldii]
PLYIVEFKQGRTDLYFRQSQGRGPGRRDEGEIAKGDLVIVEADRGKDLGTVVNDSITVDQQQHQFWRRRHQQQRWWHRLTRNINPKRLFSKATPAETSLLHSKAQDEERALALCTAKVNQRGLPMIVVAAEMQWDRRKLTFYYTATQRVDFRDLVKELFRLYKVRIYLC